MRNAAKHAPSWPTRIALAAACFFGTVQAGPAADSATHTFQLPQAISVEVLTD